MHPQVVSLIETLKKMIPADAPQLWQMLDMTREAIARLAAFARFRLADAQPVR